MRHERTVDDDATRNQARADALSGILRPPPNLNGQDVSDLVAFMHALMLFLQRRRFGSGASCVSPSFGGVRYYSGWACALDC